MRLVPDRENYVAQFWQDFCERGEELTYKRDEADRKATFIAMRARYWSLTKLARLIQERRDAERFAKSQPDSEPPVAPKPNRIAAGPGCAWSDWSCAVWACRRMFRLPLQRFRELTAREAAQDLRRRVNHRIPVKGCNSRGDRVAALHRDRCGLRTRPHRPR